MHSSAYSLMTLDLKSEKQQSKPALGRRRAAPSPSERGAGTGGMGMGIMGGGLWVGGPPQAIAEGLPVLSGTALPCAWGHFLPSVPN